MRWNDNENELWNEISDDDDVRNECMDVMKKQETEKETKIKLKERSEQYDGITLLVIEN